MHPFQATFSIGDHLVGSPANPLLIAEIACAHGGDEEECLNLIQAAAESGADAIQLQVFRAAHQVPPSHKLRPLLESLELSDSSWESLFRAAQATGKIISAFVYDEPSLELALQFDPALLKLNSADLNYVPMLEGAGQSGIPISLGTGASTLEEIKEGLRILREAGAERVLLMHGVQDFPTQIPDARLTRIGLLRKTWNLPMGYADHTEGDAKLAPWMDLLALGQGASVLEKHLTLNRAEQKTDYQASLEPDRWADYARNIREACQALADEVPVSLTAADFRYRGFQKKVAFAATDLEEGRVLVEADVQFMRSDGATGISPLEWRRLIGKTVGQNLCQGSLIPREWLEKRA